MTDPFFDDIDPSDIDWSKISIERIEKLISRLNQQKTEQIFSELSDMIDKNNRTSGNFV